MFLKGERCYTKCALDKKRGKNVPGKQGQGSMRSKMSEYAIRLREKQKARRIYGLTEEQFRHYYSIAERKKGLTGDTLLKLLELRLDNVVYRVGFFPSRRLARQMVNHGLISVNGKKVDLPGYQLKAGDKIAIKDKLKENVYIKKAVENPVKCPSWLSFDKDACSGTVVSVPMAEEYSHPINSQLIVELYSK